jgi:gamma-glutamyl hydrolase
MYQTNPALNKFYNVLSTNVDRKGVPFVSSIEAYDYPFYATQFHPEVTNKFSQILKQVWFG